MQLHLYRSKDPRQVPADDRVAALFLCRLILAQDKRTMDARFFSRALVACNGSLVWPGKVLHALAGDSVESTDRASEVSSPSAAEELENLEGMRIPSGWAVDPWISASTLIKPDSVHELRASCFERLAEDTVARRMVALATLDWLQGAPDPTTEIPLLCNVAAMARCVGMDASSTSVLQFMFQTMVNEPLQSVLTLVDCPSMNSAITLLTRWVGNSNRGSIEAMFSYYGVLVPLGLHDGVETATTNLFDAMKLRDAILFARFSEDVASQQWDASRLLIQAGPPDITHDDIPHLHVSHQLNCAVLANAARQRLQGIHLLFHGASGVGKSAYARLLAHDAGLRLFNVSPTTIENGNSKPYNRSALLLAALRILALQPGTALLFDDAEDFFAAMLKEFSDLPTGLGRSWLHQMLETSPVPILWTAVSPQNVPDSALRRFTRIQELVAPPMSARINQVQKLLLSIGLDQTSDSLRNDLAKLTPAFLTRAVRNVEIASPNDTGQAHRWLEDEVAVLRSVPGACLADASTQNPAFRPEYLNLRNGPPLERILQRLQSTPAMRMCFHGVPGTGKTDLAHFLSHRLVRQLVVKTGSDILSKWVGETEKQIAAIFAECAAAPYEKILLLDEADHLLQNRQWSDSSWRVSCTNEFLARMEQFPGTLICTTNLPDQLDGAVLRRFHLRLQFDPLRPQQAADMFQERFGLAPKDTAALTDLVPADFVNVQRQKEWFDQDHSAADLQQLLRVESMARQGRYKGPSMGFLN